jgi:uncharacterized Fe-S cluster-containing MiaB family protein
VAVYIILEAGGGFPWTGEFGYLPGAAVIRYTLSVMSDVLFIVAFILVAILFLVFIPRFFITRAIHKVIKTFRAHNATSAKSARTLEEMGLQPLTFTERLFRRRDYKPQAIHLLQKAEIIQQAEDGRLFLSEDRLATTKFGKAG